MRPVAAFAAFDLDEFRDLLAVVAQEMRRTASRRLDALSALALLGGGHPQIADKALAYYEFRYR